jgi:hypothetical protein
MLLSLGVIVVVGGALAFKAKKYNGEWYCAVVSTAMVCSPKCTCAQDGAYTTVVVGAHVPSFSSWCTINPNETCHTRTFVTPND